MPNIFGVFSYPTNASGISVSSPASSWGFGSWVTLVPVTQQTSFLQWFTFSITSLGALDTTEEILFEISCSEGGIGDEFIVCQIPYSFRPDTQVGRYMQSTFKVVLPEPIYCPPGSMIRVRVTDSSSSARTYDGVKIGYQNDLRAHPGLVPVFEKVINARVRAPGLGVNIGR